MRSDQRRVVIADAEPLIGLARIRRLDFLPGLLGTVSVTRWVVDEVLNGVSSRIWRRSRRPSLSPGCKTPTWLTLIPVPMPMPMPMQAWRNAGR